MKTIIENLCGKLESWGINPITLAKAIGIFLVIVILIAILVIFPKLYGILLITAICIAIIGFIYMMIEYYEKSNN